MGDFVLHDPVGGMFKVTVMDPADHDVGVVKSAVSEKFGISREELVLVADGSVRPNEEKLTAFNELTWLVLIKVPKTAPTDATDEPGATEEPAAVEEAVAMEEQAVEEEKLEDVPAAPTHLEQAFFYKGVVKVIQIDTSLSAGQFVKQRLAPAFAATPERIGIFLEGRRLDRSTPLQAVLPAFRAAPVVPVVDDLISTLVRDQPLPPDAFHTDCQYCMTTGVDCKPKPFCAHCKQEVVVDVKPPIVNITSDKTRFTWRDLESLTGQCLNDACEHHEKYVEVHFHCMCTHKVGRKRCPSNKARQPLASYRGGRVETLLEALYHNQYFVRDVAAQASTVQEIEQKEQVAEGGAPPS